MVEYLVQKYGFKHYSVRDFITQEILARNLPVTRDNMVAVANDLRTEDSAFIVKALYQQSIINNTNSVIESIRTTGEIDSLRQNTDFYLLAIDADSQIRYQRIVLRKSATDSVSYDKFLNDEQKEMQSSDPGKQNLAGCIQKADFILNNKGTREELHKQVNNIMTEILNNHD